MKKTLVFSFAVALCVMQMGVVLAENPDTGPGCGLGKLLWADSKNQKNIAPQVLMVTTNGTGMNTFAISSGTSGCTNDGQVWASEKVNMFASTNLDHLMQDMAQGNGEHLASLATLMGVPDSHHGQFFAMTQEHYPTLLAAGQSSSMALVQALNDAMAGHSDLAQVVAAR